MKLFLKDPDLISEMFEPLIGKKLLLVVNGTPKTLTLYFAGRIYDCGMGDDRGAFIFQDDSGNREVVDFDNVWEMGPTC